MSGMRKAVGLALVLALAGCSSNSTQQQGMQSASKDDTLEAYTQLGLQYLRAGDTLSAKDALQRALEIDDDYAGIYNGLALIFQVEQEFDLAEKNFRKAVSLDSDSAIFHNNFGAFLYARGRYEEACTELARATEDPFYPRRAQSFENLGRCYRTLGRSEAAQHAFERALHLGPVRSLALLELTDLHLRAGRVSEAQSYYDRFSELIDSRQVEHSAQSLWLGIQLSRLNGNGTRAATYSLLLKSLYPQSPEFALYKESMQ
ncbi:type IV pilus biogenesis/stability protein PilW [Marinobacterium nitratireducens]|uniref:Type IV pilus biogenesis/stability protein PilW n=2 Tax=Marinobacterium nitratireducens TaxID=518897 RepID=A0A918DVG3_9GAMM|nr:type IV pilus biogenesis/stability protein PilW [Marinobacterium nitratireducens]